MNHNRSFHLESMHRSFITPLLYDNTFDELRLIIMVNIEYHVFCFLSLSSSGMAPLTISFFSVHFYIACHTQ